MLRAVKIILPIVLIVIGVMAAGWMINNPPKAQRVEQSERVTTVQIMGVVQSDQQVVVSAQGTVTPAKQIILKPEVTGKVIELSQQLVPGGLLPRGKTVIKVDPRDYQFNVEAQKERVADAQYRLKLEKGQQEVARQEWALLEDTIPTTEQGKELALRIPQIEKAEASLEAANSALQKAELALSRTEIRAPFNSIVLNETVDLGQVVNPQGQIATIAGTDQFWVQVSIPVEHLSWIDIPQRQGQKGSKAIITSQSGTRTIVREGHVIRLLGDLDQAGRLARLIVAIDDPLHLANRNRDKEDIPLLLGSYVSVDIYGSEVDEVFVIPRNALRDSGEEVSESSFDRAWVWIMNAEDRLEVRPVNVVWRLKEEVYVTNSFTDGDRLVLSNIPTPIIGMKLQEETGE